MLLDGFFLAIECSLKYLLENTGIYWPMDVVITGKVTVIAFVELQ